MRWQFQKTKNMIDNSGKNALLFGVRNDSSIVWSIAQKLIESNCNVTLSVAQENLAIVKEMVKDTHIKVYACDVRDDADVENLYKLIKKHWQKIYYLLHGVAYGNHKVMCSSPPGTKGAPPEFIDIPFDDFMDSFNISAFSLMRICKLGKPLFSEKTSILTLTYNASQKVFPGYSGMAISKAALENMVMYLAHYFGSMNIRVNAISAGLVMTTSAGGIKGVRKLRKTTRLSAPLGNITAEDVASGALYYFSDLSQGNTGNIHYIDGGLNIMGVTKNQDD